MNDNSNPNPWNNNDVQELNAGNATRVFRRRKWWFTGVFIVVFVTSLLLAFELNKNTQYNVISKLYISLNNIDYQSSVTDLYPEEAEKLWLVSNSNLWSTIPKYLRTIMSEIKNEAALSELNGSLKLGLNDDEIR